jgi:hypothetical protein
LFVQVWLLPAQIIRPFLDKAIQSAFAHKAMRKGANAALFWEKG